MTLCPLTRNRQLAGAADVAYEASGNPFLDRLFGAKLRYRPAGFDMNAECERFADALKAEGRKPYVIPGGGSNPTGALGYAACALEILSQAFEADLKIDHIFHATGSAGTHAGRPCRRVGRRQRR